MIEENIPEFCQISLLSQDIVSQGQIGRGGLCLGGTTAEDYSSLTLAPGDRGGAPPGGSGQVC